MGFDADCVLNSNSIPRELFCPICRQLVSPRDAQQIPCGHIYCQPCVAYLTSTSQNCPQDGHVVNQLDVKSLREANCSLYDTLEKVLVRCLYYRSGCIWHGDLVACEGHISSCLYGSFPVQCNRCGLQMVHRQVQEHARSCSANAQHAQEQTATYEKPVAESVQPDQTWDTSSVSLQTSQQTDQWYPQQYQSYYQQQYEAYQQQYQHFQQHHEQQYQPQQTLQQQHYYPQPSQQIEQRQQQIGHLLQPQLSLTKDQPYVHQQSQQVEQQQDYQQSWDRYHQQWTAWHAAQQGQAVIANTQSHPVYQQHSGQSNWYTGGQSQQMQQQAHLHVNQQSISQQQYAPGQPVLALHTSEANGLGKNTTSVAILQRRLGDEQLEKAGAQDGTTVYPLLQGQHSIPQLAPLPGMTVLHPQNSMLRQRPRSPLPDPRPLTNGLQPSDLSSASIPEAFVNGNQKDKGDDAAPGDNDPPVYGSDMDSQSRAPAGTGRLPSQALERHLALSSQSQRPLLLPAGDSESLRGVSPPGFIPRPDYMAHRSHLHPDYAREPNAIEPERLRHRALRPLEGSGLHPGHLNGMPFAAEDPRIHMTGSHIDMIRRGSYRPPFLHLPNGGQMQHFMGADMGRKRKFSESSVWCRICQIDCFSVEGLQQHSQSREHQEKAMQMVLNIKRGNSRKLKLRGGDRTAKEDKSKVCSSGVMHKILTPMDAELGTATKEDESPDEMEKQVCDHEEFPSAEDFKKHSHSDD